MKQVYHFQFMLAADESGDHVAERVNRVLDSINSFIKDKVDPNVKGYFFEELGSDNSSLTNRAIDSAGFLDYLRALTDGIADYEEQIEYTHIRASYIFDQGPINVWKNEFVELSGSLDMCLTVFADYFERGEIVRQSYDFGDYGTGIVAFDLEVFDDLDETFYLQSECPDEFPSMEVFSLESYG